MLSLSPQPLTSFDLETFMTPTAALNQRNAETSTTPLPKAPTRWLSHDNYRPRPLAFTSEGEVAGGRRWRIGATIDLSFPRSLFASSYAPAGGYCSDPARAFCLAIAAKGDRYCDDASCCHDLRQHDKGQRSRALAGLQNAIPGADDLRTFRRRVGASAIDSALAVFGDFFREFGRIKGALLATDGQRAPPLRVSKGGPTSARVAQRCASMTPVVKPSVSRANAGASDARAGVPCPTWSPRSVSAPPKQASHASPWSPCAKSSMSPMRAPRTTATSRSPNSWRCLTTSCLSCVSKGLTSDEPPKASCGATARRSPQTARRVLAILLTPRTPPSRSGALAPCPTRRPISTPHADSHCPWATRLRRPIRMQGRTSKRIGTKSPAPSWRGRCRWAMRPTTSRPTLKAYGATVASPSSPIILAVKISPPQLSCSAVRINMARPMPPGAACVEPTATTTTPRVGSLSAAGRVPLRHSNGAPTPPRPHALGL